MVRDLLLILPPVVIAFAILPGLYSNHLLLFNFIIFMTLAQGINIIYGFTGYLPFGYVGFFGAGAYGFSLMVLHLHAPPLAALAAGAGAAVVLALVLTPLFRLSGAYFSIANLAASLAVLQVVSNPNLESITKGPYGISLSGVYDPDFAYAAALAVLAGTLALVIWLRNSRFGMALKAIREDPVSAAMAGIDVVRERIIAWLLSALIAGLAGGVFAWYVSVFYPRRFSAWSSRFLPSCLRCSAATPRCLVLFSASSSSTASTTPSAFRRRNISSSSTAR